jgi:hypothetical protein
MTDFPGPVPRRLPDGRLVVPARAEGPNGMVGDGIVVVGPGDELYDMWEPWFARRERRGIAPDEDSEDWEDSPPV